MSSTSSFSSPVGPPSIGLTDESFLPFRTFPWNPSHISGTWSAADMVLEEGAAGADAVETFSIGSPLWYARRARVDPAPEAKDTPRDGKEGHVGDPEHVRKIV